MAWSITPTDATINNDGVANFPPNETSSDKPYTITYTDNNGCTATTTYTVKGHTVDCNCSSIDFSKNKLNFAWDNLETKTVEITDPNSCLSSISFEITGGSASRFSCSISDNVISVTPTAMNTGAVKRYATLVLTYSVGSVTQCIRNITLEQAAETSIPDKVIDCSSICEDPYSCEPTILITRGKLYLSEGNEGTITPSDDYQYIGNETYWSCGQSIKFENLIDILNYQLDDDCVYIKNINSSSEGFDRYYIYYSLNGNNYTLNAYSVQDWADNAPSWVEYIIRRNI